SANSDEGMLIRRVRLLAQSQGVEPALKRVALAPFDEKLSLLPTERADLTVTLAPAAGATLQVGAIPPVFFRGTDLLLPVNLTLTNPKLANRTVKLTLVSTEAPRMLRDMRDLLGLRKVPAALLHSIPQQSLAPGELSGSLRIVAPGDSVEPSIDCI